MLILAVIIVVIIVNPNSEVKKKKEFTTWNILESTIDNTSYGLFLDSTKDKSVGKQTPDSTLPAPFSEKCELNIVFSCLEEWRNIIEAPKKLTQWGVHKRKGQ